MTGSNLVWTGAGGSTGGDGGVSGIDVAGDTGGVSGADSEVDFGADWGVVFWVFAGDDFFVEVVFFFVPFDAGARGGTSPSSVVSTTGSFFTGAFFFAAFFRTFDLAFLTSTLAVVSTAVTTPPSFPASPNHSRMVAASPNDTAVWCPLMSGIPSASHLATTTLEGTPSSFAIW